MANSSSGITLLGTLVAAFILTSGVLAFTAIFARTEHVSGASREQFVATGLAREGLELVYARRDNNWFADPPADWMAEMCVSDSTRQFIIDRENNGGITISEAIGNDAGRLYLNNGNGVERYTHDSTSAPSLYSRVITVDCGKYQTDASAYDPDDPAASERSVTVTSTVTWQRADEPEPRTVELKTVLFDWLATPLPPSPAPSHSPAP